tara:strand:- start:3176 stop:4396 length:1221 start_codon:yes stop_codon:yes gene_type:complete
MSRAHERWDNFKQFIADVIYDRRGGVGVQIFGAFLRGLSCIFTGIVRLRYWLYEKRIFRKQFLGCLVVVVGNLTVGGTGKTPVVEKFARNLAERGRKVAILSRGYMSKREPFYRRWWRMLTHADPEPPKVVSDGQRVLLDSEVAGDEPYMLACNLPGVIVLVDRNRVKAGQYAIKKFGADTLILDDGFQYLPLQGRLNLLLVDKTNPFGNGCLIPRGILREPLKHLNRASYVLLTKSDGEPDRELESLIRRHHPDVEIIECAHKPQYLQAVHGEDRMELASLEGKRIAALSGIAAPDSFECFLRGLGAQVVYKQRFLDHHRFTDAELAHFFEQSREQGVDYTITTEKDAVRIPEAFQSSIPFYYLRLEIDILSGSEDFEAAVSRICFPQVSVAKRDTRSPFSIGPK